MYSNSTHAFEPRIVSIFCRARTYYNMSPVLHLILQAKLPSFEAIIDADKNSSRYKIYSLLLTSAIIALTLIPSIESLRHYSKNPATTTMNSSRHILQPQQPFYAAILVTPSITRSTAIHTVLMFRNR